MILSTGSILRTLPSALLSIVALFSLSARARADLAAGGTQYNPATGAAAFALPTFPTGVAGAFPAGYVQIDSAVFPFNYNPATAPLGVEAFNGTVTSKVYKNLAGQLAFSYVFNNVNPVLTANTDLVHVTIDDPSNPWAGRTIFQVGSDSSGISTAVDPADGGWTNGDPNNILRRDVASGSGITFNFTGPNFNPPPGKPPFGTQLNSVTNDRSALIWLTTNATQYRQTVVGLQDGGEQGTSSAFAPTVPEPSTIALSVLGVALLIALRARQPKTT